MARKKQLILGAAFIAAGVAVSVFLWLNREKPPTDDPASQTQTAPPAKSSSSTPATMDPAVAGQIRDAYQKNLADNAPPGMIDLMNGRGGSQTSGSNLPPLPDPFVVPAGHHLPSNSGTGVGLPPLLSEPGSAPKPSAAAKTPSQEPPKDLPPLPPLPPTKSDDSPVPVPLIPPPKP